MSDLKIIFTGPVGAGKTTAISSISDVPPVNTDKAASDMTKVKKNQTTVAFDYGVMNLNGDEKIHLYGTPGQERFNFMWDILSTNALGVILLIDGSRKEPLNDLIFFINVFKDLISKTALAVGVSQLDKSANKCLKPYNKKLREMNIKSAVFEVDARSKTDISLLVKALLFSIDQGLEYAS